MNKKRLQKLVASLALLALVVTSHASISDATVMLERSANNKTVVVKFEGASVATVEMSVNKVIVLTRSINGTETRGEFNLPIDTAAMPDGENEIEVRLLDSAGKVVGTQTTKIKVDRTGNGPVAMTSPSVGETVQGFVEIKVGFKTDLRNTFVSFFINDEFKALKNYGPYSFVWDTTKVLNGWHEIQAYAVDEANSTYRTEKIRVFVNNPGGMSKRQPSIAPLAKPATPATKPETAVAPITPTLANAEGTKGKETPGTASLPAAPKAVATPEVKASKRLPAAPGTPVEPTPEPPVAKANPESVSKPVAEAGLKTIPSDTTSMKGTDQVGSVKPSAVVKPAAASAPTAPSDDQVALFTPKVVPIKEGMRLTGVKNFGIVMDGVKMKFDVPGRVKDGVPTGPFRYLFERKGLFVDWNHSSKTVTAKGPDTSISFQIGNKNAKINDKVLRMESAPYIFKSRSFVPMSFVGNVLDVDISYDVATNHVVILSRTGTK